jgi:hypothetical protein
VRDHDQSTGIEKDAKTQNDGVVVENLYILF